MPFTSRCKQGVQATRREDLRKKSCEYLNANCLLRAEHFKPSQFVNVNTRNKLVWNASPTVFSVPNPPRLLESKRKPPAKRHAIHPVVMGEVKRLKAPGLF
jgi:hypothetical protein